MALDNILSATNTLFSVGITTGVLSNIFGKVSDRGKNIFFR